jgi:subtilisin-like proprotein convertase family protein
MRGPMTRSLSRSFALQGLLLASVAGGAASLRADIFSATNSWDVGELVVPDGQPEGVVTTLTFNVLEDLLVREVRVKLTFDAGYNGDLYVTLSHGAGYSVLLNRVGRDESSAFGYSDAGFSEVTFVDSAAHDVHIYRTFVVGDPNVPLGGPLTGTWQPDGRTTDPDGVVSSDPRTATLASFNGQSAAGDWNLFVSDLSPGGSAELRSWSIEVTAAVPEPSATVLGLFGAGVLVLRRLRRLASNA